MERTLSCPLFDLDSQNARNQKKDPQNPNHPNFKVKGGGQECPPYTSLLQTKVTTFYPLLWPGFVQLLYYSHSPVALGVSAGLAVNC
jgi:hypothetical protein